MKNSPTLTIPLFALCASATLGATTIYIDFNTHTADGYPDASTWNAYPAPSDVTGGLVDILGSATGLSISQSGFNDSAYPASNNSGPSWAWMDAATDGAVGDFFFTSNDANIDTATITISGLTGLNFSIDLLAGGKNHSAYEGSLISYSLNGGSTWTGFTQYSISGDAITIADSSDPATPVTGYSMQAGRYLSATGLSLTSGDDLIIRGVDTDGEATAFNAMRLTLDVAAVPEPSALAFLIGFGATLIGLRRRR